MPLKRQYGVTLVELMISLLIGLLLLLLLSTLLANLTGQQGRDSRAAALRAMGDAAMSNMAMDLRRAGYAADGDAADFAHVVIGDNGHCILFAYAVPPGESDDTRLWRGFRLKTEDSRGRLQALATERANWRCSAPDDDWQDLTLPATGSVDALSFSRVGLHGIAIRLLLRNTPLPEALFEATVTPRNLPAIREDAR